MDLNCLGLLKDYVDVFEDVVGNNFKSLSQYRDYLRDEKDMQAGKLQRRLNLISKGETPFYYCNEDEIMFDKRGALKFFSDLADLVGLEWSRNVVFPDDEDEKLRAEVEKLKSEKEILEKKVGKLSECITGLKNEVEEKNKELLKTDLERKVIVSSTIKIGPIERDIDEIYLTDPTHYCDIEKCVAKYGGILDSFYQEIPDDKQEENSFEQGHDLTLKNYLLKVMKTVGTERFFKKRIKDNAEAKKIEEKVGKIMPGHDTKKKEWEAARDRILKNRYISINKIIAATDLSNQEKLMLYAMNSMYHNTDVERLLLYASQHCINADLLIYLMEDPEVCTTYENTIDFLDMFAKPSEYKMKYEFAKELISGKWYISADYNGKNTKFQLVPIDEFNELREKAGLPKSKFCYKEEKALSQNEEKPTVECAENPEVTEGMGDAEDQGGNDT